VNKFGYRTSTGKVGSLDVKALPTHLFLNAALDRELLSAEQLNRFVRFSFARQEQEQINQIPSTWTALTDAELEGCRLMLTCFTRDVEMEMESRKSGSSDKAAEWAAELEKEAPSNKVDVQRPLTARRVLWNEEAPK
jgi:hypothetical protein